MALTACRSQYDLLLQSSDVEAKYKAAFEFFETKKYKKAASLFESLSMQTTNTPKDDTVRFYWALSRLYIGKYTQCVIWPHCQNQLPHRRIARIPIHRHTFQHNTLKSLIGQCFKGIILSGKCVRRNLSGDRIIENSTERIHIRRFKMIKRKGNGK